MLSENDRHAPRDKTKRANAQNQRLGETVKKSSEKCVQNQIPKIRNIAAI